MITSGLYREGLGRACEFSSLNDLVHFTRNRGYVYGDYKVVKNPWGKWEVSYRGAYLGLARRLNDAREIIAYAMGYSEISGKYMNLNKVVSFIRENGANFNVLSYVPFKLVVYVDGRRVSDFSQCMMYVDGKDLQVRLVRQYQFLNVVEIRL